jgi:hypothetical protein
MSRSTASAEKVELIGLAHGAGREDKGMRATARRLAIRVRKTEREGEHAGVGKLAPTDQPQRVASERESTRGRGVLPLTGGIRLSGSAGARVRGLAGLSGSTGLLSPFLFLWIF